MNFKIGFSSCPNDTFIFEALVNNRIESEGLNFNVLVTDVEELNKLALNSELDITKISIATYPKISKEYLILNSGSALGNKNGPILISKRTITPDEINDLKIAIPGFNTTANLLLSIAYPDATDKVEYIFSEIEEAVLSGKTDAGLIIHESRFTYQAKGLKKIIDLGEFWENKYHQLIPLGCIVMKRNFPVETIKKINFLINNSISYGYDHPDDSSAYIKKHSQELADDIIKKHIGLYVNRYSVDLGKKGQDSIRFLFKKGFESGYLPDINKKIFIND